MKYTNEQIYEFYTEAVERCKNGVAWEFERNFAEVITEHCEKTDVKLIETIADALESALAKLEYYKMVSPVTIPDWIKSYREIEAFKAGIKFAKGS